MKSLALGGRLNNGYRDGDPEFLGLSPTATGE